MSELPKGWARATLAEATLSYETIDPTHSPAKEFAYIDIGSIDNQTQTITEPKVFLGRAAPSRARRVVASGDVLFSTVRTYLKNIAVVPDDLDGQLTSTGIAVLRPSPAIESRYLFNFVRSDDFIADVSKAQDGTLYPAVTDKDVTGAFVPLAPFPEQTRIVAKIDSLTARTTRARTDLAHIPALVAKYRSAVLELAFSGKLTVDFRGGGKDAALGLPDSWSIRLLDEISEIQGGIQVGKKRNNQTALVEVPYLRVANVQRGWLNLDEIKTIAVTPEERDHLLLKKGDVLMNEGGDRDKLGRGWVWGGQISKCIHQNHVFRIRLNAGIIPPEFVSHYANEKGQQYFFDEGTQTTNLASISKRKVAALPVPVPPFDEAVEIVHRIETAFSWLDRVSADHASASNLLPKLDAAILAKAFRGELVPQDPNDEPVEILLARIREARVGESRKPRQRTMRDKAMNRDPKELLLRDSQSWPAKGLPFDEIAKRVSLPYDEMRDALFALLGDEAPKLRQVFDKDAGCMHLRRIS